MTTPQPGTGSTKPVPKAPMTPVEIRLECAKLAVQARGPHTQLIELAGQILAFVKGGGTP